MSQADDIWLRLLLWPSGNTQRDEVGEESSDSPARSQVEASSNASVLGIEQRFSSS